MNLIRNWLWAGEAMVKKAICARQEVAAHGLANERDKEAGRSNGLEVAVLEYSGSIQHGRRLLATLVG